MALAILKATSIRPPPFPRRSSTTARVFFFARPFQISENACQSFSEANELILIYSTPCVSVLFET